MTRILKLEKNAIRDAMGYMIRSVEASSNMPLETFLDLFFTAKQREIINTVAGFTDTGGYHPKRVTIKEIPTQVPGEIPLPEYVSRDQKISLGAHMSYDWLSPKEWVFHPNVSPDDVEQFNKCVEEITFKGSIRAMWETVMQYYTEKAESHEEMRYLFPGTVTILRNAGLSEIASKVEDVNRRPNISVPKDMVGIFRYMNQWFATQIVLGTFENRSAAQRDADTVTLYLSHSKIEDGHSVLAS